MVKDADTLQGIANALIHVRNITRIAKSFRRSDDINHDITSVHDGKYKHMSFSSHFSFFDFVDESYEKRKYYVIVCYCFIIFHFCLALQTENIVQKITQPIFIFGNFINQNKKRKMR